ncbi:MAG: hypothetical protein HYV63_05800 [Candidatus Schekmanbacteria bacterium]|nr:hypothetical protein [Candidatus Schekmanbacteria bacterium]
MPLDKDHPWFVRGASIVASLFPEFGYTYACPICFDCFGPGQVASKLTTEHAPPESTGGHRVALVCRRCNSEAGHRLDSHASRQTLLDRLLVGAPVPQQRASVTISGDLLLTDTMGLLLAVTVHSASVQDRDGVKLLMTEKVQQNYPELKKLWLDRGYAGECEQWLETLGYEVDITTTNDGLAAWVAEGEEPAPHTPGFVLQKTR